MLIFCTEDYICAVVNQLVFMIISYAIEADTIMIYYSTHDPYPDSDRENYVACYMEKEKHGNCESEAPAVQ